MVSFQQLQNAYLGKSLKPGEPPYGKISISYRALNSLRDRETVDSRRSFGGHRRSHDSQAIIHKLGIRRHRIFFLHPV